MKRQDSEIKTRLEAVGRVLRDMPLAVPVYQRAYSWKREQVETFWDDLRAAMSVVEREHFLGTIVLTPANEGKKLTIIDGQQRLATATMLIAAVRNAFLDAGDSQRAGVIEKEYLASRDLRTAELEVRLHLGPEDASFLNEYVISPPNGAKPVPKSPSQERIAEAFHLLTSGVVAEVKAAGHNWDKRLFEWMDFLEDRLLVIEVRVPNEADAFMIFETLNDRGLDLTITDLLKNYLLNLTRNDLAPALAAWNATVSELEAVSEAEVVTNFLRNYWNSLYGATRERELYRSLKLRVRSEPQARELLADLEESAPLYAALLSPKHPWWRTHELHQALVASLIRLGLEQHRPLLLAAMARFASDELRRLVDAMLAWSVRGLITGGIGGGSTERAYSLAAVGVRRGELTTVEDVYQALSPSIATDEAFQSSFAVRRINRTNLSRYYLLAIDQHLQGKSNAAVVNDVSDADHLLLHVLPRRAQPTEWPQFTDETIGQWAFRIGNQYLIPRDADPPPPATEWALFTSYLKSLGQPTTDLIAAQPSWGPLEIGAVQATLARAAIDVWPRRPH